MSLATGVHCDVTGKGRIAGVRRASAQRSSFEVQPHAERQTVAERADLGADVHVAAR
jgi:hypothetical protein